MAVQDTEQGFEFIINLAMRCRDCIEGEDAVKAKTTEYLPGLSGSDNDKDVRDAYAGYLQRAMYYNTVGRTKNFLKGLVIRNPEHPAVPPGMEFFMDDVTSTGMNFYNFYTFVLDEILASGWGGILVDFDQVPEEIRTRKEASENGYRCKIQWYPTESIFNTEINIRLYQVETSVEKEFDVVEKERILVLDLDPEGYYRQRKYQRYEGSRNSSKEEWVQYGEDRYPELNGKRMQFIPFYPCGADSNSFERNKPPLLDLANVSLHHYGVYADYRNGVHFTGFPQLYVAGHKDDKTNLRMGSGVAWEFEDPTASVKYAEFTGKGLEHPEKLLDRLEGMMAKLGARMLMTEKKTAESADKVKQDSSSESSLLAGIANNISDCLSKALNMAKEFLDLPGEKIVVNLNTDYDSTPIDPSLLIALMKGVQANLISHETLLYNLEKGEILSPEVSVKEELNKLLKIKKEMDSMDSMDDSNPLSERNKQGLKDPSDEARDLTREKTDYDFKA